MAPIAPRALSAGLAVCCAHGNAFSTSTDSLPGSFVLFTVEGVRSGAFEELAAALDEAGRAPGGFTAVRVVEGAGAADVLLGPALADAATVFFMTGFRMVDCGMGSDTLNTLCKSSANPSAASFGAGLVRLVALEAAVVALVVRVRDDEAAVEPVFDLLVAVRAALVVVVGAVMWGASGEMSQHVESGERSRVLPARWCMTRHCYCLVITRLLAR